MPLLPSRLPRAGASSQFPLIPFLLQVVGRPSAAPGLDPLPGAAGMAKGRATLVLGQAHTPASGWLPEVSEREVCMQGFPEECAWESYPQWC